MVYIRHRDRMVQESVFNDLKDTLVACRWMAGTTSRPMVSPYDRAAGYQVITTAPNQVLKMAKGVAVTLVDYFPETTDPEGALGEPEKGHTPPNRMAMDDGQPGEPVPLELGSSLCEQPYRFAIAFWGASVAVCQAVMNDLRDRYLGNAVSYAAVPLFDYNTDPDVAVLQMEVDGFSYVRSAEEEVEAYELTLYFAQLTVVDIVDDASVGVPLPPVPPVPPDPPEPQLELDPDGLVTFRQAVVGETFAFDPEAPRHAELPGGYAVGLIETGLTQFVGITDLVDGVSYYIGGASSPFAILLRVESNDESALPLSAVPVGSFLPQYLASTYRTQDVADCVAAFLAYGMTVTVIGVGVFAPQESFPFSVDPAPTPVGTIVIESVTPNADIVPGDIITITLSGAFAHAYPIGLDGGTIAGTWAMPPGDGSVVAIVAPANTTGWPGGVESGSVLTISIYNDTFSPSDGPADTATITYA